MSQEDNRMKSIDELEKDLEKVLKDCKENEGSKFPNRRLEKKSSSVLELVDDDEAELNNNITAGFNDSKSTNIMPESLILHVNQEDNRTQAADIVKKQFVDDFIKPAVRGRDFGEVVNEAMEAATRDLVLDFQQTEWELRMKKKKEERKKKKEQQKNKKQNQQNNKKK